MAAPTTDNVLVGRPLITGGLFVAPVGTALPTNESTALNNAFVGVGYLTDDGLSGGDKIDVDTKKAWGGATIATLQKSREITFKFTLAEHYNVITHALLVGDANVTTTAATTQAGTKYAITTPATGSTPKKSFIFEIIGDGTQKDRIVVPIGRVTDISDVSYKDDDIVAHEIEITAFPDASGNAKYEYLNDGKVSSS